MTPTKKKRWTDEPSGRRSCLAGWRCLRKERREEGERERDRERERQRERQRGEHDLRWFL